MDGVEAFLWSVVVSAVSFLIGIMVGYSSANKGNS